MWRIIDISGQGYYIHVKNRNILVEKDGKKVSAIAFADVSSIILHGSTNSFSEDFLSACVNNSIPLIICDEKHVPSGALIPWYKHTNYAIRLQMQMKVKLPKRKQAWQKIIKAKVLNQSCALKRSGFSNEAGILQSMASHVLSGDGTNIEAQAARLYFSSLFGSDFVRSNDKDIINPHLNYGYTIVRSIVARAVVGTGLCPSISIFHSNRVNPFALVDDLIEPIRPFVDSKVREILCKSCPDCLSPASKKELISLSTYNVWFCGQVNELIFAVEKYVLSYYRFIAGEENNICYPTFIEE